MLGYWGDDRDVLLCLGGIKKSQTPATPLGFASNSQVQEAQQKDAEGSTNEKSCKNLESSLRDVLANESN